MKHADNPNHANGTCEACGEPCAVYGCRYCPACYEVESAKDREEVRTCRQKDEEKRNHLLQSVHRSITINPILTDLRVKE